MLQHILDLFGQPSFSVIEAHQASTHLSIGLLLGAIFFDFAALLFKPRRLVWQESAFWMQMLGTLALLATFALGYYGNPFAGKSSELAQKAAWHQNFAFATLGTFAVLALWRVARHHRWKRIEFASYTFGTLIGMALVVFTGWMGGHIMD